MGHAYVGHLTGHVRMLVDRPCFMGHALCGPCSGIRYGVVHVEEFGHPCKIKEKRGATKNLRRRRGPRIPLPSPLEPSLVRAKPFPHDSSSRSVFFLAEPPPRLALACRICVLLPIMVALLIGNSSYTVAMAVAVGGITVKKIAQDA
ncbi:hypothetical protein FNV43_RR07972 [Rhamnella rubrinervis]|uniref:Uncharacterized protein n=1 Tax=Rhamnella rubrinervis TaxID=2594499 RepID=A0A8K0HFP1_9ROSA|nr:hypothetical protein FNV43_RR07972 [Rhamnella rubrinervis]